MTDDDIIFKIVDSFKNLNLKQIREINRTQLEFTIAEFILCSCLIDQISGFRYNTDRTGYRYRKFVKEYLPRYNPDDLYEDLRNKLVHNYSIGIRHNLVSKQQGLHLHEANGNIYLNLEDFIADISTALNIYCHELE